ncbi:uncharacterized protein LOC141813029 [Curcuma longa]|uniref:uncharacterized protein LOC141813029 n=1 Tax=Curcuma longa TaxID=136217 RepID=UPI003D9E8E0F
MELGSFLIEAFIQPDLWLVHLFRFLNLVSVSQQLEVMLLSSSQDSQLQREFGGYVGSGKRRNRSSSPPPVLTSLARILSSHRSLPLLASRLRALSSHGSLPLLASRLAPRLAAPGSLEAVAHPLILSSLAARSSPRFSPRSKPSLASSLAASSDPHRRSVGVERFSFCTISLGGTVGVGRPDGRFSFCTKPAAGARWSVGRPVLVVQSTLHSIGFTASKGENNMQ